MLIDVFRSRLQNFCPLDWFFFPTRLVTAAHFSPSFQRQIYFIFFFTLFFFVVFFSLSALLPSFSISPPFVYLFLSCSRPLAVAPLPRPPCNVCLIQLVFLIAPIWPTPLNPSPFLSPCQVARWPIFDVQMVTKLHGWLASLTISYGSLGNVL